MYSFKVAIPNFPGFYNSNIDVSELVEAVEDESELQDYGGDMTVEQWEKIDWQKVNIEVSKEYFNQFKDKLFYFFWDRGIKLLSFECLDSPREYNFRTDELIINVEIDFPLFFTSLIESFSEITNGLTLFKELLVDRHKSHSGFNSFYAYDLQTWLTKYLTNDILGNVHIETILQWYLDYIINDTYFEGSNTFNEMFQEYLWENTYNFYSEFLPVD